MTRQTVDDRLRELNKKMRNIIRTPCADCTHEYAMHVPGLRCYEPRCRCKGFVDEGEVARD